MSTNNASMWVTFFKNAGIPSPLNASYADIFIKNRIALDMLTELNKDYLQEMGIFPIGDILRILRHSKIVNDETVHKIILAENEPIAKAKVVPVKTTATRAVESIDVLGKNTAMQSDKTENKSIFDRLNKRDLPEKITEQQSIFNRLGSYKKLEKKIEEKSLDLSVQKNFKLIMVPKGIAKKRIVPKGIAKKPSFLVNTLEESKMKRKLEMDESKHCVSFSPDVEVRLFEPKSIKPTEKNVIKPMPEPMNLRTNGIQSRLGKRYSSGEPVHHVKKTSEIKQGKISLPSPCGKMQSDMIGVTPVRERLNFKNLKISTQSKYVHNFETHKNDVFNRLGRNK